MTDKPFHMSPDADLAEKLRKDFTARHCVEEMLRAVSDMGKAVGVSISWEVGDVDGNKDVDQSELSKAVGRLATASGAMLMGGKINPISALDAQNPMRLLREKRRGCQDVS